MAYKLFTDAGGRIMGDTHWVSLAGVVLDAQDYPIFEFLTLKIQDNVHEIEVAALMKGLDAIKEFAIHMEIKDWDIYSDSKGSIKKMQGQARKVPQETKDKVNALEDIGCSLSFHHLLRKMNTYANALTNYHYNCHMFGLKSKGLHGVNRAKKVFFARLKAGTDINLVFKRRILTVEKKISDLTQQLQTLVKLEPHPARLKYIEKTQDLLVRLNQESSI